MGAGLISLVSEAVGFDNEDMHPTPLGGGDAHSTVPKTRRARNRDRNAFTLLEILIVTAILGILAAITIPQFASAAADVVPTTQSGIVRQVRQQIEYQAARGDVPVASSGYPIDVDPLWFQHGRMPKHLWAGSPMRVDHRDRPADRVYPANKTYNPNQNNPDTGWYNRTNGSFMVKVPNTLSDEDVIEMFNLANGASITNVGQTRF